MKYFGEVPECWQEGEAKVVNYTPNRNLSCNPIHTDPDEWYIRQPDKTAPATEKCDWIVIVKGYTRAIGLVQAYIRQGRVENCDICSKIL